MSPRSASLIAALSILSVSRAEAGTGFSFLNAPPAAAPAGMAGAAVAATGASWASFYNPAGLLPVARPVVSLHGQSAWDDVLHEAVSFSRPSGRGAWAVAAGALSVRGLVRTRYDPSSPDRFTAEGSVRAGDWYAGGAWAGPLPGEAAWGAGLKLVREDLDARSAWTALADVGALRQLDARWRWAVALRNAGPSARSSMGPIHPPARLQAGFHYSSVPWAEWNGDYVHAFRGENDLLMGAQFNAGGISFLRLGYRHRFRRNRLGAWGNASAGLGGRWGGLAADYAFHPFGDLGAAHRLSLSWSWKERKS